MEIFRTFSAEQTKELGYKLGSTLHKGDIVCISGDLGVGKTIFSGGIGKALGVERYITSPTFTIVNEYDGVIPLYHFDVYRISSPEEMYEIGFEEYLDGEGVVIIEWAELIESILPDRCIRVTIEKDDDNQIDGRYITIDYKEQKKISGGKYESNGC
jgi:tRNA threonylcarbamoyladenosine biosynthesis protein TsaE